MKKIFLLSFLFCALLSNSQNFSINYNAQRPLASTAVKTTSYLASFQDFVPIDCSSGSFTLQLPTTPPDGTQIGAKMVSTSSTNSVLIKSGGSDTFDKTAGSNTISILLNYQTNIFQYSYATGIWYIVSDAINLGTLDARYTTTAAASSSYVPYSGATNSVNLGANSLSVGLTSTLTNAVVNASLTIGPSINTVSPVYITTSITAGGTYVTDFDPCVVIARTFNAALTTNGHDYVDASLFQRSANGYAHNAYTDNSQFIGTSNYDHHACFQSQFNYNSSGVLTTYYGFADNPVFNTGTTGNRYGTYFFNATGLGAVQNQFAHYVPALSKGSNSNWAFYAVSNDCNFGGSNNYFGNVANEITKIGSFAGSGDFAEGGFFANTGTTGSTWILPNSNASTTSKAGFIYYNGSAYTSALEISHVSSGFSHLKLMKGGGNVSIGYGSSTPLATLCVNGTFSASGTPSLNGLQLVSGSTSVTSKGINTTAGDAATIDSPTGRFRKDATGSAFTLTNAFITANSIIVLQNVTTGITTGNQLSVQAVSGSATITFETSGVAGSPSANMDINFWIVN